MTIAFPPKITWKPGCSSWQ